ncbi:MAG TPA: NADH-quinone oxidoreductase subunit C [Anaeromyxobacteraceae bacterium]|nr:NADH-quinone oxidoreductase subunit C [Anaeromyxobacteraceae bacterium]
MAKVVIDALLERFPRIVTDAYEGPGGDDVVFVRKEKILEVCRFLKDDPAMAFNMAPYITAVDYLGQEPRFEVVYNLYSTSKNWRVRLRVKVPEEDAVLDSVTPVWRGADWFERYCFDMYGLRFTGHPDLRRLFMYDEFVGHPLRKDYPLRGRQPLTPEIEHPEPFRGPGPAGRD